MQKSWTDELGCWLQVLERRWDKLKNFSGRSFALSTPLSQSRVLEVKMLKNLSSSIQLPYRSKSILIGTQGQSMRLKLWGPPAAHASLHVLWRIHSHSQHCPCLTQDSVDHSNLAWWVIKGPIVYQSPDSAAREDSKASITSGDAWWNRGLSGLNCLPDKTSAFLFKAEHVYTWTSQV